MATLSTLEPQLASRVEEDPAAPIFWSKEFEFYSALMEAICDATLLVARPDLTVAVPFTIQPNTWLQTVPKGIFAVTNLQGPATEVWKCRLQDLDYGLISGPDWEQDIADTIRYWFPVGLGKFGVWPSVAQPQTVLMTGIANPITGIWPYDGTQTVPLHEEFYSALEKYGAAYLRLKESGQESEEGYKLYAEYLANMKQMSAQEDRRDRFIFDGATGATTVSNPTKIR